MAKPISEAPPFLRLLAEYLDIDDPLHNRVGAEAQDDLRAWANEIERMYAPLCPHGRAHWSQCPHCLGVNNR